MLEYFSVVSLTNLFRFPQTSYETCPARDFPKTPNLAFLVKRRNGSAVATVDPRGAGLYLI